LAVDEIRASIGADSLAYIALDSLVDATTIPAVRLCCACFDGQYPIDLPAPELLGKHMLEGISRAVTTDAEGVATSSPGVGAVDALQRP
jgi:amidophosphoribosyltransferase